MFFFEKKNQKTFAPETEPVTLTVVQIHKFLRAFCQKALLSFCTPE